MRARLDEIKSRAAVAPPSDEICVQQNARMLILYRERNIKVWCDCCERSCDVSAARNGFFCPLCIAHPNSSQPPLEELRALDAQWMIARIEELETILGAKPSGL